MVCKSKKNGHFRAAGFKKSQRSMHQLWGMLQTAERMSLFKVCRGRKRILLHLSGSSVELQKIPKNRIGIYYGTDVWL